MSTTFYPWLRRGVGAGVSSTVIAGRPTTLVQLKLNEGQGAAAEIGVAVTLALHGPGDVAALVPSAIRRMWPAPGSAGAPATCLAHIELTDADLPWRYTPVEVSQPRANRTSDFIPWISLLVFESREFRDERVADAVTGRVESITVTDAAALPPIGRSWAWAHVQHDGAGAIDLEADLRAHPDRYVARLLAPRRLRPNTLYTALLVPSFERGRLAGLGRDVPGTVTGLAPAWSTTVPVELPVYARWTFTTGAIDDLETLVRRLGVRPVPPTVGARNLDASDRSVLGVGVSEGILRLAGALRAPGALPQDWPADERLAWQTALATRTSAEDELSPPLYGRWPAARKDLVPGAETWFDELNGDPHLRVAAALGVEVVRRNQERLMASAWEQVAGIVALNETLRHAQLAREAGRRIHARHLAGASASAIVALCAPVMGRVQVPGSAPATSLQRELDTSMLPQGILSGAFRRLTRRLGRVRRRQGLEREPVPALFIERAASGAFRLPPPQVDTEQVSFDALVDPARLDLASGSLPPLFTPTAAAEDRPWWERLGEPRPPGVSDAFASALAAALSALAAEPAPVKAPPMPDVAGAAAMLLVVLDPENAVMASISPRVKAPPGWAPADRLSPVMAAPRFPQPLVPHLRELSTAWLAAGLADVPPDSATVLTVNRAFVHAFLVGANHEMARELLWRRYPTDQRGTYFRRFWNADQDEIGPIHEWTSKTVEAAGLPKAIRGSTVLVVRGQLLSRYPNLLVYAVKAASDPSTPLGRRFPTVSPTVVYPGMVGNLPPDVTYLAFELSTAELITGDGWYIVFHELPHEPRFGLGAAAGTPATTIADWSELTWEHLGTGEIIDLSATPPAPASGPSWQGGAADLAAIMRRRAVRLAIHASDLIGAS